MKFLLLWPASSATGSNFCFFLPAILKRIFLHCACYIAAKQWDSTLKAGGREGGKEGGRWEGGREGGKAGGGREGGREGGKEGGREGGRGANELKLYLLGAVALVCCKKKKFSSESNKHGSRPTHGYLLTSLVVPAAENGHGAEGEPRVGG